MLQVCSTNSVKSVQTLQIKGRLVFGVEQEGNSTKFYFSIVALGVTTSAYDVKIFTTYEAPDSRDNM